LTLRTVLEKAKSTVPVYTPGCSPAVLTETEICAGAAAEVEPVVGVADSHPLPVTSPAAP